MQKKKKDFFKTIKILVLCDMVVMFLAGCASTANRVDAGTQIDLTGRWNDSDVRIVCETLVDQCLNAAGVERAIAQYSTSHRGELPTVIVGRFTNTSSEHIDTSIISKMMETAIINSGKLEFVASTDIREGIRDERVDQAYNAREDTAAAIGNEIGAAFMLTGSVKSSVEKSDNTTVRAYFVDAQLTNIETNRIIWQEQNADIKKVFKQTKARL
ncbi:MAG: penicillin-binding protein activator LpoB [Spirochaetaceae bacterium]|nr:penicillin-binding protein activator LpoB [Spirochaetaceae bacterium]